MTLHVTTDIRGAAARSAFWSLTHPLTRAYCEAHSYEIDGVRYPANGFSLREFTEWTEALPPTEFARLLSAGVRLGP